jgi:glutathione S-transferase
MKLFLDNRWLSPYTYSVFCALKHKGIAFELIEVPFEKGVSLNAEFKEKSITGLIPAFEDGDLFLSESLAILEYLEEKYPSPDYPSIFPNSMADRAQARMLFNWYRSGFRPLKEERSIETVFYPELTVKTPLTKESLEEIAEWKRALSELFSASGSWGPGGGDGFLFGEFTLIDAETALMLQRLIRNGDALEEDLKRYSERICSLEPMKDFVTRKRPPYRSYYR